MDAAADSGGFHPVAKSSLERRFRDADAVFEERDGWLVPVSVPGEAERLANVGVADISYLAKLELRPCRRPRRGRGRRLVPDLAAARARSLRTGAGGPGARAGRRPARARRHRRARVIAITGPEADTVLRRLTHLHRFPSGGEVAHVTAHVLERGGGYWIVVPQEYGAATWRTSRSTGRRRSAAASSASTRSEPAS